MFGGAAKFCFNAARNPFRLMCFGVWGLEYFFGFEASGFVVSGFLGFGFRFRSFRGHQHQHHQHLQHRQATSSSTLVNALLLACSTPATMRCFLCHCGKAGDRFEKCGNCACLSRLLRAANGTGRGVVEISCSVLLFSSEDYAPCRLQRYLRGQMFFCISTAADAHPSAGNESVV